MWQEVSLAGALYCGLRTVQEALSETLGVGSVRPHHAARAIGGMPTSAVHALRTSCAYRLPSTPILIPRCRSTDPLPIYPTPTSKTTANSRAPSPMPPASQDSLPSSSQNQSQILSTTASTSAAGSSVPMLKVPSSTSITGRASSPAPGRSGTPGPGSGPVQGLRSGGYTVGPEKGTGGSTGIGSGSGRPDAQGNVFFDCLVCGRAVSYPFHVFLGWFGIEHMPWPANLTELCRTTWHGRLTLQTASNRYAPHLSSCLGLSGSTRRGASRSAAKARTGAGLASGSGSGSGLGSGYGNGGSGNGGGFERGGSPYVARTPSEAGDSDDGASVGGRKGKSTSLIRIRSLAVSRSACRALSEVEHMPHGKSSDLEILGGLIESCLWVRRMSSLTWSGLAVVSIAR